MPFFVWSSCSSIACLCLLSIGQVLPRRAHSTFSWHGHGHGQRRAAVMLAQGFAVLRPDQIPNIPDGSQAIDLFWHWATRLWSGFAGRGSSARILKDILVAYNAT